MKVVALAVAAAVILAPVAFAGTTGTTLVATDGPGFTITLEEGGTTVTTLKAGTYSFKVEDKSSIHDFHLTGPGVNVKTSVVAVTTVSWKLKLTKGIYKYVCDPHAAIMHGSFKVT
jgi:Copper binding proteins, plastocyanin/azurin family